MMWGDGGFCPWCGNFSYGGMGAGGMLLVALFGTILLIGVILLIVWLVRASSGGQGPAVRHDAAADQAMRIARERLAKGEITQEEYNELMRALGG